MHVRSFLTPDAPGTEVSARRSLKAYPVKALAIVRDQAIVTVAGKGMAGVHGIAARTFSAVEAERLSVSTIFQASSESSIGFTLPETEADRAVKSIRQMFSGEITSGLIDQRHGQAGHGGARRRRRRHGGNAWHRRARLLGAGHGEDQRRRDRAGVVGAQHLVRGQRRRRRRRGALRPRGIPAVEDRRRAGRSDDLDRRRAARIRPGRPRAGRSDRRAGRQSAAGARGRPARPLGIHLRAARDFTAPSSRSRAARRMAAR